MTLALWLLVPFLYLSLSAVLVYSLAKSSKTFREFLLTDDDGRVDEFSVAVVLVVWPLIPIGLLFVWLCTKLGDLFDKYVKKIEEFNQ